MEMPLNQYLPADLPNIDLCEAYIGKPRIEGNDLIIPVRRISLAEGHAAIGDRNWVNVGEAEFAFRDVLVSKRVTSEYVCGTPEEEAVKRRTPGTSDTYADPVETVDIELKPADQGPMEGFFEFTIGGDGATCFMDGPPRAFIDSWSVIAKKAEMRLLKLGYS